MTGQLKRQGGTAAGVWTAVLPDLPGGGRDLIEGFGAVLSDTAERQIRVYKALLACSIYPAPAFQTRRQRAQRRRRPRR